MLGTCQGGVSPLKSEAVACKPQGLLIQGQTDLVLVPGGMPSGLGPRLEALKHVSVMYVHAGLQVRSNGNEAVLAEPVC